MNTAKKFAITAVTGALLIALVLTILLLVLPDKTVADQQVYFTVADNSMEEAGVIQYVRVDENTPMTRSAANSYITKEALAEKLDITLQDVEESVAITVQDVALVQNDDGSISSVAFDEDLASDRGNIYMKGSGVIMQKPSLDNKVVNKETGEVTAFYGYGFEGDLRMEWVKKPLYRGDDQFAFYMSGSFPYDTTTCEVNTTFFTIDPYSGIDAYYTEKNEITKKVDGLYPVYLFNLYNERVIATVSSIVLSCRAQMWSNKGDFNMFYMTYVHQEVSLGDIGISIGTDGIDVSASGGASCTVYQTTPVQVNVIKDEALEAVKKEYF